MKIYVVDDSVQDGIDFCNAMNEEEVMVICNIKKDIIACPINQSIPEKYFSTIDCEVATTTTDTYTIGMSPGDFCITYKGNNIEEVRKSILDYAISKNPKLFKIYHSLLDITVKNYVAHAKIVGGMQFAFYNGGTFNCNVEELTSAFNTRKGNCEISSDDIVNHLLNNFECEVSDKLPSNRKKVKNRRGNIKACMKLGKVFNTTKRTYRVKSKMVLDENKKSNMPEVALMGISGFNNSEIIDGYYYIDVTFESIDTEEIVRELLETKGRVEWVG